MATKWIREYRVDFVFNTEQLTIESKDQKDPLDIAFDITYDPQNLTQGTMDLKVYGLKESNVAKIIRAGVKVYLSVGYRGSKLVRIFSGDVRKGVVTSEDEKHETRVLCISSPLDSRVMKKTFPSYTTHWERLEEMILEMQRIFPNLIIDTALEELSELLKTELSAQELKERGLTDRTSLYDTCIGAQSVLAPAIDVLINYLKSFNIELMVRDDTLHIFRYGGKFTSTGKKTINFSLGENLLSPPRKRLDNDQGATGTSSSKVLYELKALLEPSVKPNSIVVSSHVRNDEGNVTKYPIILKVSEVKHTGRYRGDDWYTEITGSESSDYLFKGPIPSVAYNWLNPYKEPKPKE